MYTMNITIRNIDEESYRALKARAALEGKPIGKMINEAIRALLDRPGAVPRRSTLRDLKPEPYPAGNERLSQEIRALLYGERG